jgi:hypothetical protein
MTESKNGNELFDTLAKILLRCFVLGYCILLLWFVVYLIGGELLYGKIGGKLFGLTPHEVDIINYCGMAVVKVLVLLFFLCPYIAIRLVLRKRA